MLILGAFSVAVLLAAVFSPVRGDSVGIGPPSTSSVTIDGRTFRTEESGTDDLVLLQRVFEKFGVKPPEDFDTPETPGVRPSIYSGRLVEVAAAVSPKQPPVPRGLIPEHSLRLESGSGPVDLLFGKMDRRGASVRNRLAGEGWELAAPGDHPGRVQVLEKATGKEKAIVCLDEAEGAFLLVREGGR
jgi:hypothetical protein